MQIINTNTKYTVDTYQTFDTPEMEEEDYNTDYNMDGVIKDLSNNSIDYIKNVIDSNIIQDIKYTSSTSPREYNFNTDSYIMDVEYNAINLNTWIQENINAYKNYCLEVTTPYDGYMPFREYEVMLLDDISRIEYYINSTYNDDYLDSMYDSLYEVYFNNIH